MALGATYISLNMTKGISVALGATYISLNMTKGISAALGDTSISLNMTKGISVALGATYISLNMTGKAQQTFPGIPTCQLRPKIPHSESESTIVTTDSIHIPGIAARNCSCAPAS